MIAEALEYLLTCLITPCPHWTRRLGYLHQAVSLRARHRRWRAAWRPHVQRCRHEIVQTMAQCRQHRRAVVLGSGLLIEVPIAELAAKFDEVVLVDAVHLPLERWHLRRWPHVHTVTCDLTDVARFLLTHRTPPNQKTPPTPATLVTEPPAILTKRPFDFAVSANLLSQLPLAPLWFLEAAHPPPEPASLEHFAQMLIEHHLSLLHALAPVTCLITDREARFSDGDRLIECSDLLFGIPLPPPDAEWLWHLAPRPEADPDYDVIHRVTCHRNRQTVLSHPFERTTLSNNFTTAE